MTPYFTARMPPAFVATFPPRLALVSPGYTGYTRPSGATASSSWSSVTPASTTAQWLSTSISTILAMRSNAHTMPSALGMHAPERPVPEPRAVTGAPNAAAARKTADTSRASPGRTTARGRTGVAVSASSCVYSSGMAASVSTCAAPTASRSRATRSIARSDMGLCVGGEVDGVKPVASPDTPAIALGSNGRKTAKETYEALRTPRPPVRLRRARAALFRSGSRTAPRQAPRRVREGRQHDARQARDRRASRAT